MRKTKCRFKFKRALREHTVMQFTERKDGQVRAHIHAATNDGWLNRNIRVAIQYFRANSDSSILVDIGEVADYMVKYVTKPEKSSKSGDKIMREILNASEEDHPVSKILRRLFIKMKPDKDIGKEEITHRLLQLPYVSSDLSFVRISLDATRGRRVNLNQAPVGDDGADQDLAPHTLIRSVEDLYARRCDPAVWETRNNIRPARLELETMSLEIFA